MPSALIGSLRVNLSADTAEFQRGLTNAERIAERFGYAIGSNIRRQLLAFGAAAAAAAGPAALGLLVKSSMETISTQVDLARRVGASVAAIQTLQEAAKLAGASQEALTAALGRLNAQLGKAAREGAGPAFEALQRLGLSARELSAMDADERIATLADRMAELGFSSQQYADTLKELGIKQQEIINLFIEGSSAIEETRRDLKDWGVLLSDVDAAKVEMAGDAWDKLGLILTGVGNQLAVRLAPLIIAISDSLGDAAREGGGFGSIIDKAISLAIQLFAGLQREIYGVRIGFDETTAQVLNLFDTIAGAPPNLLATIFGGTAEDYGFKPINESFGKLKDTLAKPPSAEEWDAWLAEIRRKADEAAKAAAAAGTPGGLAEGEGESEAEAKAREKRERELADFQEHLAKKLASLQESLLTEREAALADYEQRLLDLEDFHARGLLSDEEYRAALRANAEQLAEKMKDLNEDVARDQERLQKMQQRAAFDTADNIISALESVFGESKLLAVAQAVINTAQAVTRTLAEYGATPWGFAAAAAAAAAGLAQIATIKSTSRGGGGGHVTTPTAAPAANAQAAPGATPGLNQTLYIAGVNPNQVFTGEQLRELISQIQDYQRDGGKVVLAPV